MTKQEKDSNTVPNNNSKTLESVPIIDIAPLLQSASDIYDEDDDECHKGNRLASCIQDIKNACQEWGFFYIQNHGISNEIIDKFRSDMAELFHLESNVLDKIRRNQTNSRGYFDDELTKNKLDWKRCFDVGAQDGSLDNQGLDGQNQWPIAEEHVTFEETIREYYSQMEELSKFLLGAICKSLGVESTELDENFDGNHTSYLRLNYYPICDEPESHMAIHRHTDAGALTILYQDDYVTSLQVHRNDKWYYIPPRKDTFVINIGDMIQVWSNDKYKAPLHRVKVNSTRERYSAPFFYNPAYKTDVQPIEVDGSNEGKVYNVVNWGDFRAKRFAGDYADVGEEVQIAHYKIAA
jgi:isopenicillin N synthase-like dioxygenase